MNLWPVRLFACRFAEGVSQEHPVNAPDFRLLFVFGKIAATRSGGRPLPRDERVPFSFLYSVSRRVFFRLRLRANACLTRSFWPGFK